MKRIILLFGLVFYSFVFGQEKKTGVPPPPAPIYPKVLDFEKRNKANVVFFMKEVHHIAHYSKGSDDLKNKIIEKIDFSKWRDIGAVLFTLTFLVEKDGSVSDVEVNNEKNTKLNEEIKKIITDLNLKFSPAEIEDKSVRSYTSIKMRIDFYE